MQECKKKKCSHDLFYCEHFLVLWDTVWRFLWAQSKCVAHCFIGANRPWKRWNPSLWGALRMNARHPIRIRSNSSREVQKHGVILSSSVVQCVMRWNKSTQTHVGSWIRRNISDWLLWFSWTSALRRIKPLHLSLTSHGRRHWIFRQLNSPVKSESEEQKDSSRTILNVSPLYVHAQMNIEVRFPFQSQLK